MDDCKESDILSLTTTLADEAQAARLAQRLLAARLAACVQVEPGLVSHYRWQGEVHADAEVRLTVKSLPALQPALCAFLASEHPYALPQLLWHTLQASPAYAAWVRDNVRVPDAALAQ